MPKQTKPPLSGLLRDFPETHPNVVLFMILGLAFFLRWPWMGESAWLDEIVATHAHLKNVVYLASTIGPWERMPFYYVCMFAWGKIFGDSEIVLRIPSLLAGLGSIYLTYRVTRLITSQKMALLAAFFLALSPVHIWYSTEARPYIVGTFFLIAALYAYWKLKDADRFSNWHLIYVISMFANVFTHPYLFIFAALFCVLCLFSETRSKTLFLILNMVIIFVFTAYVLIRAKIFHPIFGLPYLRPFTWFDGWTLYGNWFPTGNTLDPMYPYNFKCGMLLSRPWALLGQIFFMAASVWGIISLVRRRDRADLERGREILTLLLSLPLFFLILTYGLNLNHIYLERNAVFILPYYWIAIVVGLAGLRKGWVRNTALVFSIALAVLSTAFLFVRQNEWTVYKPNPDMRAAAAYFGSQLDRGGSKSIIWSTNPASELAYYYPKLQEQTSFGELRTNIGKYAGFFRYLEKYGISGAVGIFEKALQEDPNLREDFKKRSTMVRVSKKVPSAQELSRHGVGTIYLIVNQYWTVNSRQILEKLKQDKEFNFLERKDFKGLEIYKFEIKPLGSGSLNQKSR